MTKKTYQPKVKKRMRKFGFRSKITTTAGKNLLKRRRLKGRKNLTV